MSSLKQKLSIRPKLRAFAKNILQSYFVTEYSKDITAELNRRALVKTVDYVVGNMGMAKPLKNKFEVLADAIGHVSQQGAFCEFGVFKGQTLRFIAGKTEGTVHGFDSFEGLPEGWYGNIDAGHFKLPQPPSFDEKNIQLHVGWFDRTLPLFVDNLQGQVAFLHIDCDIYSSTRLVFDQLRPFIGDGTVIVFDEYFNYPDWENHEFKAFQEFIGETGMDYSYLSYCTTAEQVAVKIKGN